MINKQSLSCNDDDATHETITANCKTRKHEMFWLHKRVKLVVHVKSRGNGIIAGVCGKISLFLINGSNMRS